MTHWHKWQALSWGERWTITQSCLLLPLLNLALVGFSLRRVQRLLGKITPLPTQTPLIPTAQAIQTAQQLARLVSIAAYYGPYRATCLRQALMLWWLLRWHDIDGQVRIGIQKVDEAMQAHAWVEVAGYPLQQSQQLYQTYAVFRQPIVANGVDNA